MRQVVGSQRRLACSPYRESKRNSLRTERIRWADVVYPII